MARGSPFHSPIPAIFVVAKSSWRQPLLSANFYHYMVSKDGSKQPFPLFHIQHFMVAKGGSRQPLPSLISANIF